LNGNMVAGTSKRRLLVRVGKEQHAPALARPDARPMEMSAGRWRAMSSSTRRRGMTECCANGSSSGRTQCTRPSTRGEPKRLARRLAVRERLAWQV